MMKDQDKRLLVERVSEGGLPAMAQPSPQELKQIEKRVLRRSARRRFSFWKLSVPLAVASSLAAAFLLWPRAPDEFTLKGPAVDTAPAKAVAYPVWVGADGEVVRITSPASEPTVEIPAGRPIRWIYQQSQGFETLSVAVLGPDSALEWFESTDVANGPEQPAGFGSIRVSTDGEPRWLIAIFGPVRRSDLTGLHDALNDPAWVRQGGGWWDGRWVNVFRVRSKR